MISKMIKKVKTVFALLKNIIFRQRHYKLRFYAKETRVSGKVLWKKWYYDFKDWGFKEDHLQMVAGADDLCELYKKQEYFCNIDIFVCRNPNDIGLDGIGRDIYKRRPLAKGLWNRITSGASYECINIVAKKPDFWICPVTLFVLGRYPKYIAIRR